VAVLAILDDLIFGVMIQDAARRAGIPFVSVASAEALEGALINAPSLVIVDLNLKRLDAASAIRRVKVASPETPVVAYYPHVQTELKQLGIAAGADRVMARSAFSADVNVLVSRAAPKAG
jgi:CheY-like chemotaxis protein